MEFPKETVWLRLRLWKSFTYLLQYPYWLMADKQLFKLWFTQTLKSNYFYFLLLCSSPPSPRICCTAQVGLCDKLTRFKNVSPLNFLWKERILRAMDEIQLTEMTENNLLSKYIRLLEAFKKEITYFFPCYLMIQEFISLAKVTHLCNIPCMLW